MTALFPFVIPDRMSEAVLRQVAEVAAAVAPFDYRFARTGWFGQQVLYLAPDQAEPFRELTERLWAAFPDCPPYGGQFEEVIPHLTIGEGAPFRQLLDAEEDVRSHGVVEGRAHRLTVMAEGEAGRWSRLGFCTLGYNGGLSRSDADAYDAAPGTTDRAHRDRLLGDWPP